MEKNLERRYQLDALKAICAFFVVCLHAPFPGVVGEYINVLSRMAVPIYFIITGYFYSDIQKRGRQEQQIRKILKLVLLANLIYLIWDGLYAMISANPGFFLEKFTFHHLLDFLIFNDSPLASHLWYLGALLYALSLLWLADKWHCRKFLYYAAPLLLIGDLVFGKYSLLIFKREFPVLLVRNFLFVGLPYLCIGMMIRDGLGQRLKKWILVVLFSLSSLLERYLLVTAQMNATREHYISTTFLAVSIFLLFLKVRHVLKPLAWIGRKCSTWLYILHPIFLTVIGTASRKLGGEIYGFYLCLAPVWVYAATLGAISLFDVVRNKIKESGKNVSF